jgi:hypothetical protein
VPKLGAGRGNPEATLARCRGWLDGLPDDAVLELVDVPIQPGTSLDDVRARIAEAEAELRGLRVAPVPATDINARIRAYVRALAANPRPVVRGIAAGDKLQTCGRSISTQARCCATRERSFDISKSKRASHGLLRPPQVQGPQGARDRDRPALS